MNEELIEVLKQLATALGVHGDGCTCNDCCDCTTIRTMEQTAVRANEAAAFAAAESQKAFVQQNGAQFAQLLSQQQEYQKAVNA